MLRIGLTLLLATSWIACGSQQDGDRGTAGDHRATPSQVVAVNWVLVITVEGENGGPTTRVSLSLTDETGATRIEHMGEFEGECREIERGPGAQAMEGAILGLSCPSRGGPGTELRLRRHLGHVILLRARTGPGIERISYDEAGRAEVPIGAEVRAKE